MDKNLNEYISKLIELDSKAVELKGERDSELMMLEANSRNELKCIDKILEEAALMAKQEQDRIIEAARLQAREMSQAAELKASEVQAYFASFKEDAARDIWKQLLGMER